jgi:hypothetical protein
MALVPSISVLAGIGLRQAAATSTRIVHVLRGLACRGLVLAGVY